MKSVPKKRVYLKDYHDKIVELCCAGRTATEITKELGVGTCGSIRGYCSKNNIKIVKGVGGSHNFIDLSGKEYGQMVVIDLAGHYSESRKILIWNCICNCGRKFTSRGADIRQNKVKTCGCQINSGNRRNWQGYEEISKGFWKTICENRHKRRKVLDFDITIEYIWELFIQQQRRCIFTNLELTFGTSTKDRQNQTASLDRIDSNKGYIKGNVQWVHKHINKMKNNYSDADFIWYCKKVAENNE